MKIHTSKEAMLTAEVVVLTEMVRAQNKRIAELDVKGHIKHQLFKPEWVELTDDEKETLIHRFDGDPHTLLDEVNARLKEKNSA